MQQPNTLQELFNRSNNTSDANDSIDFKRERRSQANQNNHPIDIATTLTMTRKPVNNRSMVNHHLYIPTKSTMKRHFMKFQSVVTFFSAISLLSACTNQKSYDASGSFEAVETIISADANGKLLQFDIEEGQSLEKGRTIGYIDSVQLYLKKVQLQNQIRATLAQKPDAASQLAPLYTQLETAKREQKRLANLVAANAANQKQLDDINAQVDLIQKQIESTQKSLSITTGSLDAQIKPLQAQIDQLNDQLSKCKIVNLVNGTVLSKYAEPNELVTMGKPLYKVADLSEIILRAYLTNNQLAQVKLNQKVQVLTDDGKGGTKPYEGSVTWISSKAEFTPKTIQTKDERANLVYAVKINVKNDGLLKIGMYAEIKL